VSPPVLQVFSETLGEACAHGTADINTLHLLTAMANRVDSNASRLLEASGATGKALKVITSRTGPVRSHLDRSAVVISPNLRLALTLAADIARSRTESVSDLDLLAALLQMQDGGAVRTLVSLKVAVDRLRLTVGSATSSPTPSRYPGLPPEG
jgi:ATP-dependent Clp protease ATP-binding subunit ClpA